MKIIRNGMEIELTNDEVREAGWEYDRACRIEDLMSTAELTEIEPDDERRYILAKEIEPMFEEYIESNDSLWDAYWLAARMAIEDCMEEPV